MGASTSHRTAKAIRPYWRRWTAYVELFARAPRRRRRIDPRGYEACQHQLLAVCRRVSSNGDRLGQQLAELAGPWVSIRAFDLAEQELLDQLVERCRDVDRHLGVRRLPAGAGYWLLGLLVAVLILSLCLFFWPELTSASQFAYNYAAYWAAMLRLAVQESGVTERIVVATIAVVLLGGLLLSRVARS